MKTSSFSVYQVLLKSKNYIPMGELVGGTTYNLICRNQFVGIWFPEKSQFVIRREKYGNIYLFGEYHWDVNDVCGTAKPFESVEESPFNSIDLYCAMNSSPVVDTTEEVLDYLKEFDQMDPTGELVLGHLAKYQ